MPDRPALPLSPARRAAPPTAGAPRRPQLMVYAPMVVTLILWAAAGAISAAIVMDKLAAADIARHQAPRTTPEAGR